MMNALIGLGLGIVIFALIAGVGLVVMANFATAVSDCPTGYTWNANGSGTIMGVDTCVNDSVNLPSEAVGANITDASEGSQSLITNSGYIQSNLVTWIPAIIALGIGLLFIGALMGKRQKY